MKKNLFKRIVVAFILGAFYFPLALLELIEHKHLTFSNQTGPSLIEATNFATLNNGGFGKLSVNRLTICGSIYINFFRGLQSFYTVRTYSQEKLWFSLKIDNQDTTEELYTAFISYVGGSVLSHSGAKLRLNLHAWLMID